MCNGFGAIVDKDLNLYITNPDKVGDVSHSAIIEQLGWEENKDTYTRRFVRVECADWTMGTFRFDEYDSLPGWAEEHKDEIITKVTGVLDKVSPAWAEYKKMKSAALAEYEKMKSAAWAEYEKVRDVASAAWAEYEKMESAAWAEYEKVRDVAWDDMVSKISIVTGYR